MKKLFMACSLIIAVIGVMASAVAVPIYGDISFGGITKQNKASLKEAKPFTKFREVVVSETGEIEDDAWADSGQSFTFNPFKFRSSFKPNPLAPLWTFDVNGETGSFYLTDLTISKSRPNTLSMYGTGIASVTHFDDVPGIWNFTANRAGGKKSRSLEGFEFAPVPELGALFEATDVASVPEPATMLLLGFGLIGLAGLGRKKLIR